MARGVGELVVTLGLNAGDYFAGLTKAERAAQSFASKTRTAILEVGKAFAALEVGRALFENTKEIIAQASALSDLSDITGSSVESLSKLANQAAIAGADFATLQTALQKLSVGMADTSKEGSDAQKALALLGITTRDPVEAMTQAGQKLNDFNDGINKVAIAAALFGAKAGPAFLATLKDMSELGDVNATVTKKQADEAEALEKAYRRLSVEATGFRNAILSDVVPALSNAIAQFTEGIRLAGGFASALRLFGTLSPFDTPSEGIKKYEAELKDLQERQANANPNSRYFKELQGDIDDTTKKIKFLYLQFRQGIQISPDDTNVRDKILGRKRDAPPLPGKPDKVAKDKQSDAERYIEALKRQAEGLAEVTTQEKLLNDLRSGRVKLTQAEFEIADGIARQIDAFKELDKWVKESRDSWEAETKAAKEALEVQFKANDAALDEAEKIRVANDQLRDEIAIILGGENARVALEKERVDNAIATTEEAAALARLNPLRQDEAAALELQIEQLRERRELLNGRDFAKQLADEAKALQDVKNMFSDTFANAFSDFITGTKSAKDAFKSFVDDLTRQISRIASQNIANAIFGGNSGSGSADFFATLAKFAAGLFSGGAGGAGGGSFYGGGLAGAAMGGTISGPTIVGERGPELFVPHGTGTVVPNNKMSGVGNATYNVTVNVAKGADTASVRQATLRGVYAAQDAYRNR